MGRSFGLHASAGARLAFAAISDDQIRAILGPGPFHRYTASTITDPEAFLEDVRGVRRSGVAVGVDDLEDGLTSVALPVGELDPANTFQIGILGPSSRLGLARREALVPLIQQCARDVERALQTR
jgi:DNA-binding IclR family transcriptional regulator